MFEAINSFFETLKTRARNPLVGTYILAYVFVNGERIIRILFEEGTKTIDVYNDYPLLPCGWLWQIALPFFIACLWVYYGPLVSRIIHEHQANDINAEELSRVTAQKDITTKHRELEEERNKIQLLRSEQLGRNIGKQEAELNEANKELVRKNEEINDISGRIDKENKKKEMIEDEIDSSREILIQKRKEQNDIEEQIGDLRIELRLLKSDINESNIDILGSLDKYFDPAETHRRQMVIKGFKATDRLKAAVTSFNENKGQLRAADGINIKDDDEAVSANKLADYLEKVAYFINSNKKGYNDDKLIRNHTEKNSIKYESFMEAWDLIDNAVRNQENTYREMLDDWINNF